MKLLFRIFFVGLFFSIIFLLDGHGELSFWTAMLSLLIIVVWIPSLALAKWVARRDREDETIEQERQAMSNEGLRLQVNAQDQRKDIAQRIEEEEWHERAEAVYLN